MYKIYLTGQEFLDENLDIIRNDPLGTTFFEVNAKAIDKCNQNDFAVRIDLDGKLLLAIHVGEYPLVLYGSECCANELAEVVAKHKFSFGKTIGALELSTAFLTAYEHRVGGSHNVNKSMDVMSCDKVNCCHASDVEQATERDIEEIAKLQADFTFEALGERAEQSELMSKLSMQINNFALIRKNGEIVAIAEGINEGNGLCRISYVYTKPTHRNKGYSRNVVTYVTHRAIDDGNIAYLHVDKNNPISNHLYLSIGYIYNKPRYEMIYIPLK